MKVLYETRPLWRSIDGLFFTQKPQCPSEEDAAVNEQEPTWRLTWARHNHKQRTDPIFLMQATHFPSLLKPLTSSNVVAYSISYLTKLVTAELHGLLCLHRAFCILLLTCCADPAAVTAAAGCCNWHLPEGAKTAAIVAIALQQSARWLAVVAETPCA